MTDTTDRFVAWRRTVEPDVPLERIETHTSVVLLQGDRAYKLKKPVRFAFLDLSSVAARRENAEREVRLNRRLAPDVYLGTATIPGAGGEVVVVMRRLPPDRCLAAVAATEGRLCVDAVAATLARFHRGAATGGVIDAAATHAAVTTAWRRESTEIAALPAGRFDARLAASVAAAGERYLAGRSPLFTARVAAGRARDGHGDLLAGDVFCLPDGPRLIDCLEFDDDLRAGDVCADVAFLVMDLERLGHPDLARRLSASYRSVSGDDWPASYEHFHIAARARVRAKVAALSGEGVTATAHLALADRHLAAGRVRLVVVGGPPATGKSTLARALSAATRWPVLRTDEIRRELGVDPGPTAAGVPLDAGIHAAEWNDRTYAELLRRAEEHLGLGQSVIIDATFGDPDRRREIETLAARTASDAVLLRCAAPIEVCAERAARRSTEGHDASDADAAIATALGNRYPDWPAATVIDSTERGDAIVAALRALGTV